MVDCAKIPAMKFEDHYSDENSWYYILKQETY